MSDVPPVYSGNRIVHKEGSTACEKQKGNQPIEASQPLGTRKVRPTANDKPYYNILNEKGLRGYHTRFSPNYGKRSGLGTQIEFKGPLWIGGLDTSCPGYENVNWKQISAAKSIRIIEVTHETQFSTFLGEGEAIFGKFDALESITIGLCDNIRLDQLQSFILYRCRKLKKLTIVDSTYSQDMRFESFERSLKNKRAALKIEVLESCPDEKEVSMEYELFEPKTRKNYGAASNIEFCGMGWIGEYDAFTKREWEGDFRGFDFKTIFSAKHVMVSQVPNSTNFSTFTILKYMFGDFKNLESLTISGCKNVHLSELKAFIEASCPGLQKLTIEKSSYPSQLRVLQEGAEPVLSIQGFEEILKKSHPGLVMSFMQNPLAL